MQYLQCSPAHKSICTRLPQFCQWPSRLLRRLGRKCCGQSYLASTQPAYEKNAEHHSHGQTWRWKHYVLRLLLYKKIQGCFTTLKGQRTEPCTLKFWIKTSLPQQEHWRWVMGGSPWMTMTQNILPGKLRSGTTRSILRSRCGLVSLQTPTQLKKKTTCGRSWSFQCSSQECWRIEKNGPESFLSCVQTWWPSTVIVSSVFAKEFLLQVLIFAWGLSNYFTQKAQLFLIFILCVFYAFFDRFSVYCYNQ